MNRMTLEDLLSNIKINGFEYTQKGNYFELNGCELHFHYENNKVIYNGYEYDVHEYYEDVFLEFIYDETFISIDFDE